jgi:hypothetical protein
MFYEKGLMPKRGDIGEFKPCVPVIVNWAILNWRLSAFIFRESQELSTRTTFSRQYK